VPSVISGMKLLAGILVVTPALLSAAAPAGIHNVTFGQNHTFRLEYSSDGFGMQSHGAVDVVHGRLKMYALPQAVSKLTQNCGQKHSS